MNVIAWHLGHISGLLATSQRRWRERGNMGDRWCDKGPALNSNCTVSLLNKPPGSFDLSHIFIFWLEFAPTPAVILPDFPCVWLEVCQSAKSAAVLVPMETCRALGMQKWERRVYHKYTLLILVSLFIKTFWIRTVAQMKCPEGLPLHASHRQEPGSLLKIHNNKHPTKDILNNGFTQKPKTAPSKSKYLLSPSVAGAWEGGLCVEQSEEGNHGFGTDNVSI